MKTVKWKLNGLNEIFIGKESGRSVNGHDLPLLTLDSVLKLKKVINKLNNDSEMYSIFYQEIEGTYILCVMRDDIGTVFERFLKIGDYYEFPPFGFDWQKINTINKQDKKYSKNGLNHLYSYLKDFPQDSHEAQFNEGVKYALQQLKLYK